MRITPEQLAAMTTLRQGATHAGDRAFLALLCETQTYRRHLTHPTLATVNAVNRILGKQAVPAGKG